MATIESVAKDAGVSIATVSHVINGTRYVSESTRNKVLRSMEKLNYQPNRIASSLRSKKSHIIGLIIPDISNFFFTGVARYIENELKKEGYSVFLGNTDENIEFEKNQISTLNSHQVDGLIIAPSKGNHTFLKKMKEKNKYPIIFIDRNPENMNCVSILVDNFQGSYKAVNYLISKGHNKIGIITGLTGITTTKERLKGYKKALKDNNISIDNNLIMIGDSRYKTGFRLTKEIIKNTDITALYVANNLMCVGAMEYLNKAKINIPGEVAVIGFDDYKWASITNPPLSVIKQPVKKIGITAANELLSRLNNKDNVKISSKEIRLKTRLIIRESC